MYSANFEIHSATAMHDFGATLSSFLSAGDLLFLQGELGAGKTTLTAGLLHGFEYSGVVKSPTYAIVESYHLPQCTIFHFDLYRLNDPSELLEMGFGDYLQGDAILLIEWPEKAEVLLPKPTLTCKISYQDWGRELMLQAHSKRGEQIIQQL